MLPSVVCRAITRLRNADSSCNTQSHSRQADITEFFLSLNFFFFFFLVGDELFLTWHPKAEDVEEVHQLVRQGYSSHADGQEEVHSDCACPQRTGHVTDDESGSGALTDELPFVRKVYSPVVDGRLGEINNNNLSTVFL